MPAIRACKFESCPGHPKNASQFSRSVFLALPAIRNHFARPPLPSPLPVTPGPARGPCTVISAAVGHSEWPLVTYICDSLHPRGQNRGLGTGITPQTATRGSLSWPTAAETLSGKHRRGPSLRISAIHCERLPISAR